MIQFTTVRGEFGWMSNMSDHSITQENRVFPRAEHWFICSRFGFNPEIVDLICEDLNPISVKIKSKQILKNRPELLKVKMLSEEDVDNMRKLIQMKVEQHPWIKWKLLETGNEIIYENVTNRVNINDSSLFWGATKICEDIPGTEIHWVGKNVLGTLWMELRQKLFVNFFYDECKKSSDNGVQLFLRHIETGEIVQRSEDVNGKGLTSLLIKKIVKKYYS